MTYREIAELQIANVISNTSEFKNLAKQCLSIVQTSTAKDEEIVMWINAAVSDLVRLEIDVAGNLNDGLIQGAIVMFVKANFGMVDVKEKELAQKTYAYLCNNLSLSSDYKLRGDSNA